MTRCKFVCCVFVVFGMAGSVLCANMYDDWAQENAVNLNKPERLTKVSQYDSKALPSGNSAAATLPRQTTTEPSSAVTTQINECKNVIIQENEYNKPIRRIKEQNKKILENLSVFEKACTKDMNSEVVYTLFEDGRFSRNEIVYSDSNSVVTYSPSGIKIADIHNHPAYGDGSDPNKPHGHLWPSRLDVASMIYASLKQERGMDSYIKDCCDNRLLRIDSATGEVMDVHLLYGTEVKAIRPDYYNENSYDPANYKNMVNHINEMIKNNKSASEIQDEYSSKRRAKTVDFYALVDESPADNNLGGNNNNPSGDWDCCKCENPDDCDFRCKKCGKMSKWLAPEPDLEFLQWLKK